MDEKPRGKSAKSVSAKARDKADSADKKFVAKTLDLQLMQLRKTSARTTKQREADESTSHQSEADAFKSKQSKVVASKGKQGLAVESKSKQNKADESKSKQNKAAEFISKQSVVGLKNKQNKAAELETKHSDTDQSKSKQNKRAESINRQTKTVDSKSKLSKAAESKCIQNNEAELKNKKDKAVETKSQRGQAIESKCKQSKVDELISKQNEGVNLQKKDGNATSGRPRIIEIKNVQLNISSKLDANKKETRTSSEARESKGRQVRKRKFVDLESNNLKEKVVSNMKKKKGEEAIESAIKDEVKDAKLDTTEVHNGLKGYKENELRDEQNREDEDEVQAEDTDENEVQNENRDEDEVQGESSDENAVQGESSDEDEVQSKSSDKNIGHGENRDENDGLGGNGDEEEVENENRANKDDGSSIPNEELGIDQRQDQGSEYIRFEEYEDSDSETHKRRREEKNREDDNNGNDDDDARRHECPDKDDSDDEDDNDDDIVEGRRKRNISSKRPLADTDSDTQAQESHDVVSKPPEKRRRLWIDIIRHLPSISADMVKCAELFANVLRIEYEEQAKSNAMEIHAVAGPSSAPNLIGMSSFGGDSEVELQRNSGLFVDKVELENVLEFDDKPRTMVRRLMRLIVGDAELLKMSAGGRGQRPGIPKEIRKVVLKFVRKNTAEGTARLGRADYIRTLNCMCSTLRSQAKAASAPSANANASAAPNPDS